MPFAFEFDETGDYVFQDNGTAGDDVFSIIKDGAHYFDVPVPPDEVHFFVTTRASTSSSTCSSPSRHTFRIGESRIRGPAPTPSRSAPWRRSRRST